MSGEETPASYRLHTDNAAPASNSDEERVPLSPSRAPVQHPEIFRDEPEGGDDEQSYEEREISLQELMYGSSSFYELFAPGTLHASGSLSKYREPHESTDSLTPFALVSFLTLKPQFP